MREALLKYWYSLNYRYCKMQEYLFSQRGMAYAAGTWNSKAYTWQTRYLMAGRSLR